MFQIDPLSVSVPDWPKYLAFAKQALGRDISKLIDRSGSKKDMASFIGTLLEAFGEQSDLGEAGSLLRHAYVSFMAILPVEMVNLFREEADLAISSENTVAAGFKFMIVSGNLEQWRTTIINCSSLRANTNVRLLCNKFMAYFEQAGLANLWSTYSRTPMTDQTFRLTHK